jgi:hypothetical protein
VRPYQYLRVMPLHEWGTCLLVGLAGAAILGAGLGWLGALFGGWMGFWVSVGEAMRDREVSDA